MSMRSKTWLVGILTLISLYSRPTRAIDIYDIESSPLNNFIISQGVGSALSSISLNALEYIDDRLHPITHLALTGKILARTYAAFQIALINHEIFGHGGRALQVGAAGIDQIHIGLFSGYADPTYNKDPYDYQQAMIAAGGNEINHIVAENLKQKMIASDCIHPTKAAGYIFTQGNQSAYIFFIDSLHYHKKKENRKSDIPPEADPSLDADIAAYARSVARAMAFTGSNHSADQLYQRINYFKLFDLLDPFMYYSLYSHFTDTVMMVPMLKLSEQLEYLPATRLVMAPYGLEIRLLNHFRTPYTPFQFNISYGDNFGYSSYTAALLIDNVFSTDFFKCGIDVRTWKQPDFVNQKPKAISGGLGILNLSYDLTQNIQASIGIGYKTLGFQEDQPVDAGMIFTVGGALEF